MIRYVLIFLLLPLGSKAACLPDSLVGESDFDSREMRVLEETVQKFESVVVRDIPSDLELVVRLDPLNPRINAEVVKVNSSLAISVWGGMLSHSKMDSNTMLLLLCHEIGHFLGGPPLKSRNGWSSTEGQSDYYSTANCYKDFVTDESTFIKAALNLTSIYAEVNRGLPPRVDQCDETITARTNYGYPGLQCRLDTLLAGWNQKERPRCWFFE